jgi:hypothetical protein
MEPIELRRRARFAYEVARARAAVPAAAAALALGALASRCDAPANSAWLLSVPLAVLAFALLVRGRGPGRAVWPALGAGAFAGVLPMVARWLCPPELCHLACLSACALGGAAAGGVLAALAARDAEPGDYAASALCVAGLAASVGCSLAGIVGVATMVAAAIAAGGPVWRLTHVRR